MREGETPTLTSPSALLPSPSPLERGTMFLTFRGTLSVVGAKGQGETLECGAVRGGMRGGQKR